MAADGERPHAALFDAVTLLARPPPPRRGADGLGGDADADGEEAWGDARGAGALLVAVFPDPLPFLAVNAESAAAAAWAARLGVGGGGAAGLEELLCVGRDGRARRRAAARGAVACVGRVT